MLTINIQGQGELGSIVVDAQADGTVRGFVDNPEAGLDGDPNVTAGSLIGLPGTLTVTKDLSMSENWSGTVELQNGEIGQDFAYYFTLSEQTPTAVSVGVRMNEEGKVLAAGALVLQMMPDADDTNIRICEHVLSGLKPMTAIIQDYDDASLALLAEDLFDDTEVLETIPISFKCTCSKEKTAGLLHTVAPDQIKAMIEEDHGAEVTCNFCSSTYHFNEHELREILNDTEKHLEETEELESHVAEDSGN
ncbi:Hsp33 family molecular chaperone HslO [Allobaculum sp. Allo2]|nr:Hsp33 family molecular chaperone HslO [Allobaculum sp. Allo2]